MMGALEPLMNDLTNEITDLRAQLTAAQQERDDWKKRALAQLQTCFAHQEKYEALEQERDEWKQRYDSGEGAYRLACDAQKQALAQRDVALRLQREQRYAMEAAEQERAQAVAEEALLRDALTAIQLRCREGDRLVNWLPTIERLATAALDAAPIDAAPLAAEHLEADRKMAERQADAERLLDAVADTRECQPNRAMPSLCDTHQWNGLPCGYGEINRFLAPPQARATRDEECVIHSWSMDPSDPCRNCGAVQQQARATQDETLRTAKIDLLNASAAEARAEGQVGAEGFDLPSSIEELEVSDWDAQPEPPQQGGRVQEA